MDFPPPLPPSLPSPPPLPVGPGRVAKKKMSGLMIALLVASPVLLISLLAGLAVPVYNNIKRKATAQQKISIQALPPAQPLTSGQKKEAMDFAWKIADAVNKGEMAKIRSMTRFDGFVERTFAGTTLPFKMRIGFQQGLNEKAGGLLSKLSGSRLRPVRIHERDGYPAVTMRALPAGGGVDYLDLLILPDGDRFQVIDMYTYLLTSFSSEHVRHAMLLASEKDTNVLARVLGLASGDKKQMDMQLALIVASGKLDFKTVHDIFKTLPTDLQKGRLVFALNLQALQELQSDPAYTQAYQDILENAREILGADSAIDLLLVDLYFLKEDYAGALTCVRNVIKAVGEDAYLYNLLGETAIKAKDLKLATECLEKAEQLEPGMMDLIDLHMQVKASQNDFGGVVKAAREFAQAYDAELTPDIFDEPVYEGFRKSPEFAEWVKSLEK